MKLARDSGSAESDGSFTLHKVERQVRDSLSHLPFDLILRADFSVWDRDRAGGPVRLQCRRR
jgi:hypothetical protein